MSKRKTKKPHELTKTGATMTIKLKETTNQTQGFINAKLPQTRDSNENKDEQKAN